MRFVLRSAGHLLGLPLRSSSSARAVICCSDVAKSQRDPRHPDRTDVLAVPRRRSVIGYLVLLFWRAPSLRGLVLAMGLLQAVLLMLTRAVPARSPRSTQWRRPSAELPRRDAPRRRLRRRRPARKTACRSFLAALPAAGHGVNPARPGSRRSWRTATVAVRTAAPLAMLWLGASRVLAGDMSTGTMLALCALGASFLGPVASLVQNGQRLPLPRDLRRAPRGRDRRSAEQEPGRRRHAAPARPARSSAAWAFATRRPRRRCSAACRSRWSRARPWPSSDDQDAARPRC